MRDNQFAHCATAEQVLHSYAVMPDPEPGWTAPTAAPRVLNRLRPQ